MRGKKGGEWGRERGGRKVEGRGERERGGGGEKRAISTAINS